MARTYAGHGPDTTAGGPVEPLPRHPDRRSIPSWGPCPSCPWSASPPSRRCRSCSTSRPASTRPWGLLAEAAGLGARLVVFPEAFLSLYPSYAWAHLTGGDGNALWERLWASAVDAPGPVVDRLVEACREHDVVCAIGVNEREAERPGSLYNTLLLVGPDGLLHKHRKLLPTHHERLFHGIGAGDDLQVTATPLGRLGGLICWENRMPLARWAVYQGGPQIWLAPTADDSEGWQATIRHIAIEAGAFVVAVPQFIQRAGFPDDFPWPLPDDDVLGRGGAAIIAPASGEVIAGPLYDAEGLVIADCDLRQTLHAKRWFDAVGHYSRADVLWPPATR